MRGQPPSVDARRVIVDAAMAEGFDAIGFAPAHLPPAIERNLRDFIALDHHGTMDWMETHLERRSQPDSMWPDARSAIVLGVNYGPETPPTPELNDRRAGVISVYAQGDDYHEVIKPRLKAVARTMAERLQCGVKVFVDTAPLMEKPLAQLAGLGWQGKHTNLVSREFGSWLFLGVILTTLDLSQADGEADHCGTCRACLDACPTQALPQPYQIDARRCISYLTIEHKGPIPADLRALIGNRIYGCDDCLAACPWNKYAKRGHWIKLHAREELKAPSLAELAGLDDTAFRRLFAKNPAKRIGRDRFVRNVLIAIGNSADRGFLPAIEARLQDPSSLVRGAAIWALKQVAPDRVAVFADLLGQEREATVRAEWNAESGASPCA